ncbi:hypothetical protein J5500_00455 [Candidatus Saccharibacteria bacterium]|nr:hypothetical protein [Candidatus Saccharibacteria bacterium]
MEDIPKNDELISGESDERNEELGEERAEEIGEALMRAMRIAATAVEKQTISQDDFVEMMSAFEESNGVADFSDEQTELAEKAMTVYVETVNSNGTWSEALHTLKQKGYLFKDEIVKFLEGGMPPSMILNNEDCLEVLTGEDSPFFEFPNGLLSKIYEEMATSEEGEGRFKKLFIDNHKMDLAVGRNMFDAVNSGDKMSDGQRADLAVFRKMGGNVLKSTIRGYYQFIYDYDSDYEKRIAAERGAGQRVFDYLTDESLMDAHEASELFEDVREGLSNGRTPYDVVKDSIMERAIESDLDLHSDNEDVDYWISICKERKENVFNTFREMCKPDGERLLDGFDLSNESVIRLLADTLGSESVFTDNVRLYKKINTIGLLDSEMFREGLVRAINAHYGALDEQDLRYRNDFELAAVKVFASRRGLLEKLGEQGLFDKYPACQKDKTIAKVVSGSFKERDRLSLFGYGFSDEEYYDENGEVNQTFFEHSYGLEELAEILDDNEARGFCEHYLAKHDYARLAEMGREIWERGGISGPMRGFFSLYEKLHLDKCSISWRNLEPEDFAKYFDENGEKPEFWQECIRKEDYGYLGYLDEAILSELGFDASAKKIMRGMSENVLGEAEEITEDNILSALTRFIHMDAIDWDYASESDLKIKEAFSESNLANKDEAMRQLRQIYEEYLASGEGTPFPKSLTLLADYMHKNDGAGPLTQIEAFLDYCGALGRAGDEKIKEGSSRIEAKIKGWDNTERANYYATGAEILMADPRLYQEFIDVFDRIDNPRDFKVFAQEIFPLFRAKLALLKEYDDHSNGIGVGYQDVSYANVDMKQLCNDLHNLLIPFTFMSRGDDEGDAAYRERREKGIATIKEKLFGEISGLFTEKFGILPEAIPHELDKEGMRSVENMVLYLSNIKNPDADKKGLIGFYLALQLTKKEDGTTMWDAFRKGENCDPFEYLAPEVAQSVADRIWHSGEMSPLTMENTGIGSEERLREFRSALQDETSEIRVGSVSTIDVRLQDLKGNIEELADPDLYDDAMDKAKAVIISQYSPKTINKVATALWLREAKGKETSFDETEEVLAGELIKLLTDADLEVTPENIQKYLQQGFKELGPVAKTLALIREKDVERKVAELQDMLVPQGEVADIFGELGEQFRPESGVLALNADLEFLHSIISKGEKNGAFSGDESERARKLGIVREYLDGIEQKMVELDAIYSEIVKSFESIREPKGSAGNRAMADKMKEIRRIIDGKGESQTPVIVSNCSTNMNIIIENMRACLSCKTKGINNDTDLTFGESHKFYVYSRTGAKEKGSISDEIVYFVPTGSGEDQRMSFVMDQIYGTKNSDILLGHIGVLAKKARALKDKYPEVPISIFITTTGASSCSVPIDSENLLAHLASIEGATVRSDTRVVDIPESGYGDHYIEIGGEARESGPRMVSGVEIIFN